MSLCQHAAGVLFWQASSWLELSAHLREGASHRGADRTAAVCRPCWRRATQRAPMFKPAYLRQVKRWASLVRTRDLWRWRRVRAHAWVCAPAARGCECRCSRGGQTPWPTECTARRRPGRRRAAGGRRGGGYDKVLLFLFLILSANFSQRQRGGQLKKRVKGCGDRSGAQGPSCCTLQRVIARGQDYRERAQ